MINGGKKVNNEFCFSIRLQWSCERAACSQREGFVAFFIGCVVHFLVRTQLDLVPIPAIYLNTLRIKWKSTNYPKLSLMGDPVLSSGRERVLKSPLVYPPNQAQFSLPTLTFPSAQASFPDDENWRLHLVQDHLPNKYYLKIKAFKAATVQFSSIQSKSQTRIHVFVHHFTHALP